MAAYSAAATFRQTLNQLLDSDKFPLYFSRPQIESLHENVCYLQSFLDQISFVPERWSGKMSELETNVRDAIYLGQNKVEYLIKGSSPERSEEIPFKEIEDRIAAVAEDAKLTAEEIKRDPQAQENPTRPTAENSKQTEFNYSGKETIVGQDTDFQQIREWLVLGDRKLLLIPITGAGGMGKTTLARSIYNDPLTIESFHFRAWVTVSQQYSYEAILSALISSIESMSYKAGHNTAQGNEQMHILLERLYKCLFGRRYLIVIDDIWELRVWDGIKVAFPDNNNGSRIIFTTRIHEVAEIMKDYSGLLHKMQFLSQENSWKLLCEKVFGDDPCPPHLTKIGQRIAKNCRGLPLSITLVGGLLSQQRGEIEHWKRVEEDTTGSATKDEDSALRILSLSYNHLPAKLKGCFLYMGAFPEDSEIRASKLIKLWVAEGFLSTSRPDQDVEVVAQDSLRELVNRNLILVHKVSSSGEIKVCVLHDLLRELAEKQSRKENFFYSTKKYAKNQEEEDLQMQRRVSFHRNILICHEEVYNSTRSIQNARSLLYVGPHHHHPLPFSLTFDLLRVLDAFTVYFIDFPDEFLKLIHLTYLSLTYNHEIPPQISNLQKLQVLLVRRQPKIIVAGVSFLPDEIWEMPNLRHLWFTETDFPPLPVKTYGNRALLINLQTLANVNAAFFTNEVLDNMPNVKKLSTWIEGPEAIKFDLTKLRKLECFKFVVLNPIARDGVEIQPENFFPRTVKRLHLRGCRFPWHFMKFVADELKDLEVLKLREHAFHGEEWIVDYEFANLKFLLIEYLHFKIWEASSTNFPSLRRLILRHCYKLKEIPSDIGFNSLLELIELVDCSPAAVDSAIYIKEEREGWGDEDFQVRIFSSWK